MKRLQPFKLGRKTTLAGSVDNQQHFAPKSLQWLFLASNGGCSEVIYTLFSHVFPFCPLKALKPGTHATIHHNGPVV
jgi:hypothetical protein